jgi:hypothetical protein
MSKLKLMTIVGTRPEIIRLSAVIKKCDIYFEHRLVHTGQNYDYELNQIFFDDLGLRAPDYYLNAVGAELVNTMLDEAILTLNEREKPIIHSDRGCHYRWPGWIERMEREGLIRSMSKKGCSPDNAACEGFFLRLKNEMFYGYHGQVIQ